MNPITAEMLVKERMAERERDLKSHALAPSIHLMSRIQALFNRRAADIHDTVEAMIVAVIEEVPQQTLSPLSTQEIRRRVIAERIASHHAMTEIEAAASQQWQCG